MQARFPFHACTGLCFWMFFSVASFLASWTRPRRFWSPTWPQLGPIWEPCWAFFGTFLGVVVASHLKIVLETIFDRLRTPLNLKKHTKTGLFFYFFASFACSLLKPILNRFWVDFGAPNRPKIVPKRVENHVRFLMPS